MKILLNILVITILSINLSLADKLQVFDFTETELAELKVRKVRGADNKTLYTVGTNDNGNYLKSVADNAASGLGKEIKIDLEKTPFINITWKIEKDLSGIRENYNGQWDSGAEFAEDICEGCGYIPRDLPTWIKIDWEETWEDGLSWDYSITKNGHVFNTSW